MSPPAPLASPAPAKTPPTPPTKLRLAYLVNQYPQPSHSFIRREIAALEELGHEVMRLTLRATDAPLVDPADQAEKQRTRAVLAAGAVRIAWAVGITLLVRPRKFLRTLGCALRIGLRSDRGLRRHLIYFAEATLVLRWLAGARINYVHAHFGTNATTVAMFARLLGGPRYSFTVHGPEEFDKPEFLHLEEKIAHAERVVAISEFGRSQLLRQCRYADWHKIHVVRCGVDERFLTAEPTLPLDDKHLVCVARLHEQKGLPILIEAAGQLARENLQFTLELIGDGPLRPEIEMLLDRYALREVVTLAGWKSSAEVRAALEKSRALVLPSFAEGLPVVIMEALALHRPVISTYVAGIVELVEPGISGWLVPPGAARPLVEAMRRVLLASPDELAQLGAAGARRVAQRHVALQEAARLADLIAAAQDIS